MAMAKRVSKLKNANRFFVASDVHPQTLDVVRTRAETFGFEVIVDDAQKVLDHQDVFGGSNGDGETRQQTEKCQPLLCCF